MSIRRIALTLATFLALAATGCEDDVPGGGDFDLCIPVLGDCPTPTNNPDHLTP
jgi:hypothetical protein